MVSKLTPADSGQSRLLLRLLQEGSETLLSSESANSTLDSQETSFGAGSGNPYVEKPNLMDNIGYIILGLLVVLTVLLFICLLLFLSKNFPK